VVIREANSRNGWPSDISVMSTRPTSDYAYEATRALGAIASAPPGLDNSGPSLSTTENVAPNGSGGGLSPFCRADLSRADLTGLALGHYALGERLGRGGMGTVYRAVHMRLERQVAVKFVAVPALSHPEAAARFRQESLALGRLKHDHIVDAVDAGTADGVPYLVTEYILGKDLSQRVARSGPLPVGEACAVVHQAALGLAYAHQNGFLHRDVKPSNLLIDQTGRVKVIDFGLVRSASHDDGLTTAGQMLGTWDYVAPEQANDPASATPASDIYSLGCTLIYLLSGSPPFASDAYRTSTAKLKGHLVDRSPTLAELECRIPRPLANVLEQMLAKSPAKRPADMNAVAAALASFSQHAALAEGSLKPRTPLMLGGGIAAAILLGALCWIGAESLGSLAIPLAMESTPPSDDEVTTVSSTTTPIASPESVAAVSPRAAPDFVTETTQQTASAAGVALSMQKFLGARRSKSAAVESTPSP
jgi:serine/threonine protein kinase